VLVVMDFAPRLDKNSLTSLRDTQAGGVEDVHVLSRRNERHPLAGRRRFSTADLGNEQPVVYATHMGEGGFAKPFDEFDDAFGDERTACPLGKMLRTDTDRQRVADLQRRRRQIEVTRAGPPSTLSTFASKKFIAGEPMKPATKRLAGE
jgi:hypothetical protein